MTKTIYRRFIFILFWVLFYSVSGTGAATGPVLEETFPGLAMNILTTAHLVPMESETLLKAEGVEIRLSDIEEAVSGAPSEQRPLLKQNLFLVLEQIAAEQILFYQALSNGISAQGRDETEVIQDFLSRKADSVSVTDEEAAAFYESNKEMVGGMAFDQVKESIKSFLADQKKQEAIERYLATLGETANIEVNRKWAEAQYTIARDNPVDKARSSGKPSMIEFGATGCVPCDMMQPILEKVEKKYGDRLNVVFVHVRENPFLGARFGIRSIPVQVFYDKNGKEVFRHTGFLAEAEVMKQIEKMEVASK
ncbi:MAG: thioredoxin family protein [Thermodesulfobacteriota bacterium]